MGLCVLHGNPLKNQKWLPPQQITVVATIRLFFNVFHIHQGINEACYSVPVNRLLNMQVVLCHVCHNVTHNAADCLHINTQSLKLEYICMTAAMQSQQPNTFNCQNGFFVLLREVACTR